MKNFRKKIHQIMEPSDDPKSLSWKFDVFLVSLILLNVIALILETVQSIRQSVGGFLYVFEIFSIIIFTVEYVFRLWGISEVPKYSHPLKGRLRYAATPIAIVDLLAFLPFYLPLLGIDLRFFRMFRIFRLLRLLKVSRYFTPLIILTNVFEKKKQELLLSVMFLIFMLIFLSCIMYFIEHEAQPEVFSSIPATMWWGVATLTTVGYGDVYPVTTLGRLAGGCIAILGIGFFALPAGILSSGFSEEIARRSNEKKNKRKNSENDEDKCPTCGK